MRPHFENRLMKPARNSLWSRIGRYVTFGVIATALAGAVMFLHWRHDRREVPTDPSLTGLASQMRHDAAAWTRQEKDASEMLRDIHDDHVAAIGVSPNAILVSTTKGEKYFVTDHNAVFSNALLLDEMKAGSSSPYQLVWLPHGYGTLGRCVRQDAGCVEPAFTLSPDGRPRLVHAP
jgi:cell division protease FtsH